MLGQTLGSYTLERELGRGGMGAVYTAVHALLGRRAAVKILLPELSRNQEIVQRFFNEARAATAIKHPSIVEIYDFGWAPDGSAYIVMELMEGESLAARLRRVGRLPAAAAVTIARQVANALAAAHKAGIIHRDLKPDNVFLVSDVEVAGGERVKLLDFGIAKLAADGAVSRTSTGAIMGTPLYMSPEQCEGARQVDARSDLYSLGCMLFEMVTGRVPFVSEGVGGLIGMHLHVPPPALRSLAPDAPAELEDIVARLLAKAPGERFQSAEALAAALGRAGAASTASVTPAGVPTPPPGPLAVGTAVAAPVPTTLSASVGVAATLAASQPPPPRRRGRGPWLAVAGVLVVGGVAGAVVLAGGGSKDEAASAAPVGLDAAAVAPVVSPDAAPAPIAAIDAGVDPARRDRAVAALGGMRAAASGGDWNLVAEMRHTVYDNSDDGDPLRDQAEAVFAEARPKAIADARAAIQRQTRKGECAAARKRAETVVDRWGPDAQPLVKLAAACSASSSGGETVVTPPPPPAGGDFTAEMVQAKEAMGKGQYALAMTHCEAALAIRKDPEAFTVCAISSCSTKNVARARRYLTGVLGPRRDAVRKLCAMRGVELEPEAPAPAPDPSPPTY